MKRILSVLLAAVMLTAAFLSLASCSGKIDPAKDLENVRNSGVLKVGMECAYAPFNWTQTDDSNGAVKIKNAEGYANGYDVQMAQKIADKLGVKLEVYSYKWEALVPAVQSGALDCIIAGMSPTEERKKEIDFSSNYYVSNLVIIVNEDSEYADATTLADFKGAKIGAQDGTFHANDALPQIEDVDKQIMDDFTVLYTALTAKTIDGYIAEEPTAYAICAGNDSLRYVALENNSTGFKASEGDTAIAVGLRKGTSLASEVSAAIDAVSVDERSQLMLDMVEIAPSEE